LSAPEHWLDDSAILIVLRHSPLDAIMRDAYRLNSERPVTIEGIDFDVVNLKLLPADPRCTRVRLKRRSLGASRQPEGQRDAMSARELRNAMALLDLTIDALASTLGLSRRLIAGFRKDQTIPPHVALAVRQLLVRNGPGP